MASLFKEFRLKDVVLRNRIAVSPLCQYSSDNGFPNDWHFVHLGSRAVGWLITDPQQDEQAARDQHTDLVMLAREMPQDPYWPYHAALKLGNEQATSILPIQYARAVKQR